MYKKSLMIFLAPLFACFSVHAYEGDITKLSLPQMRVALDNKQITSEQLITAYLKNIEKNDKKGKKINAVIYINPDALAQARIFDANNNGKNLPLAGIPFLVKDNINTEGIATTGGTLPLKNSTPQTNAFVVQKLIDQGAIVLGKTNLSELAASYGRLGYSSLGGQTLNPFNEKRDASGSSSGSAAAVAMSFAPFALGTDTSGSIRGPASTTATVGLRPSLGLTGRSGVIPLSLSADTVGVITRDVTDQAIVLDVINAVDLNDAATLNLNHLQNIFYKAVTGPVSLEGKRIGIISNFDGGNSDVDKVRDHAVALIKNHGAIIEEIKLPEIFNDLWSPVLGHLGLAEFRPQMNAYLSALPSGSPQNMDEFMQELIKETKNGTYLINPGRFQGLMDNYTTNTTDSAEYISILTNTIPYLRKAFSQIMDENNFDALLFATMRCPPSVRYDKQDLTYKCAASDPYTPSYIASALGLPEISIPGGRDQYNLPVGISFLGRFGDDAEILKLAKAFETVNKNISYK